MRSESCAVRRLALLHQEPTLAVVGPTRANLLLLHFAIHSLQPQCSRRAFAKTASTQVSFSSSESQLYDCHRCSIPLHLEHSSWSPVSPSLDSTQSSLGRELSLRGAHIGSPITLGDRNQRRHSGWLRSLALTAMQRRRQAARGPRGPLPFHLRALRFLSYSSQPRPLL